MRTNVAMGLTRCFSKAVTLVGPLLIMGCQQEGPFLQTEEFLTEPGKEEVYIGGGCMPVTSGSGSGAGTAPNSDGSGPQYSYTYEGRGSGVHFMFTDDAKGEVLEERSYDEAFIASGRRDELTVETAGVVMRFVHWGTEECGTIRDPEP